jgi:hypothetical protein
MIEKRRENQKQTRKRTLREENKDNEDSKIKPSQRTCSDLLVVVRWAMLKAVGGFVVLFAVAVTIFYQQLVLNPIDFQPIDLTGKVVIVTGGTSGIGLESVRKFVEWNATVILPVRNIPKGELVKKHLLSTPVSHTGTIELMEMDLTSFSSVRKFAKEFLAKDLHLDILVLNAVPQPLLLFSLVLSLPYLLTVTCVGHAK